MKLWIVRTGYSGATLEGVLVHAMNADEALAQASHVVAMSFRGQLRGWIGEGYSDESLHARYLQERINDARAPDDWVAQEIELPYFGEFA